MSRIAAVPRSVAEALKGAEIPPGHRFRLYYPGWTLPGWKKADKDDQEILREAGRVPASVLELIEKLRERQEALVPDPVPEDPQSEGSSPPESSLILDAVSTAPFVTGMGMEPPIENGFAFLDPYGVPYLPGSSIKGVLRDAAGELVESGEAGWNEAAFRDLFGNEPPEVNRSQEPADLQRGALAFWDCIPAFPKDPGSDGVALRVDIMNPHASHYYQEVEPPSEDRCPVPIYFLTVPPRALFRFVVGFDPPGGVTKEVREKWKGMVLRAFEHAFDWLGFGAKSAVGYGRMEVDQREMDRRKERIEEKAAEAARKREEERRASLSPLQRLVEELGTCEASRCDEIFRDELDGESSSGLEPGELRDVALALEAAYRRTKPEKPSKKQEKKLARLREIRGGLE